LRIWIADPPPFVGRLHRICLYWQRKRRFLPQSATGKAIHYLLKHWLGLCRYLDDPKLEIDNNLVENAIRPTAVERRIGCSLVLQKPGIAALSSTPSSLPANVIALIPALTFAMC
jgi:Transposase IS66 family